MVSASPLTQKELNQKINESFLSLALDVSWIASDSYILRLTHLWESKPLPITPDVYWYIESHRTFTLRLEYQTYKYLTSALASPTARAGIEARAAITALTAAQITAYKPYTYYASAAYCSPSTTIKWTCGTNCEANPSFVPVASGGDGDSIQYWFVGYDTTLKSVIVSHQGTDVTEILSVITDTEFALETMDSTLFTGVSSSVKVHDGFGKEQAKTATTVLSAVKTTMSTHSTSTITTTGHSLGAALSLLDALYLSVQLPSASVNFIGYGLPRVGNQAFANLIDSKFPNLAHINNKEDMVPIVPGELLGYVHPSGEKHILDNSTWVACPGQDNDSQECSTGDVPTIFNGDIDDHIGPYDGVEMGC